MTGRFSTQGNSFLLAISFFVFFALLSPQTWAGTQDAVSLGAGKEAVKTDTANILVKAFAREMAFIKTFSSDMPVQYKQEKQENNTGRTVTPAGPGLSAPRRPSAPETQGIQEEQVRTFQQKVSEIQGKPEEMGISGNPDSKPKNTVEFKPPAEIPGEN